jgi:hypothetical protein
MVGAQRPKLVWVIAIFYVLSAGWVVLSFILIYTGFVQLNAAQRMYFNNLGIFDWVSTVGEAMLTLTGTALLFILRKSAIWLFVAALTLAVLLTARTIFLSRSPFLEALGRSGSFGMLMGWGIYLVVIWYASKLRQAGTLR